MGGGGIGVVGFPSIKIKKFQSVAVSWFLGFKVSKFQRLRNIEYFLEDIDPILPTCHCMFSGRYRSHVQDFGEFIRRIDGICRCPTFRKLSQQKRIFEIVRFPKIICLANALGSSLNYSECPGVSKDK